MGSIGVAEDLRCLPIRNPEFQSPDAQARSQSGPGEGHSDTGTLFCLKSITSRKPCHNARAQATYSRLKAGIHTDRSTGQCNERAKHARCKSPRTPFKPSEPNPGNEHLKPSSLSFAAHPLAPTCALSPTLIPSFCTLQSTKYVADRLPLLHRGGN